MSDRLGLESQRDPQIQIQIQLLLPLVIFLEYLLFHSCPFIHLLNEYLLSVIHCQIPGVHSLETDRDS